MLTGIFLVFAAILMMGAMITASFNAIKYVYPIVERKVKEYLESRK